jgi:hypothetical protein
LSVVDSKCFEEMLGISIPATEPNNPVERNALIIVLHRELKCCLCACLFSPPAFEQFIGFPAHLMILPFTDEL